MDEVELRIPAQPAFVSLVRAITTALGAQCDLTIDQIDDLHIAVDEACALVLPHAGPHDTLTARFGLEAGRIEFRATVPARAGAEPDRRGLSWAVLSALSDDLRTSAGDDAVSITVVKQRAASAP